MANRNQSDLGEKATKAAEVWLKKAIDDSDQSNENKKVLGAAVELIILSTNYILSCAKEKKSPNTKDALRYFGGKSLIFAKLVDNQKFQCAVSLLEVAEGTIKTGTIAVSAAASAGITSPALLIAGLSFLLTVLGMIENCGPVVKQYLKKAENAAKIRLIYFHNMEAYKFEKGMKRLNTA